MTKFVNWNDVPLVLGTQQVADILDVHVNTVKSIIQRGELPAFKVGRVLKVNKSDLRRFMGLEADDNESHH